METSTARRDLRRGIRCKFDDLSVVGTGVGSGRTDSVVVAVGYCPVG